MSERLIPTPPNFQFFLFLKRTSFFMKSSSLKPSSTPTATTTSTKQTAYLVRNNSPTKNINVPTTESNWTQSSIRSLIKQGNLNALEEIVIQGYGDRLIGEVSGIPLIEDFLERIPDLLVSKNKMLFVLFVTFIKIIS